MDIIRSVDVPEEWVPSVVGKGYSDAAIINGYVKREYNIKEVLQVVDNNPNIHIYSTWGKGPSLVEWKECIGQLAGLIPLVSPSMAARVPKGEKKFDYMLSDWKERIALD